jgi:glycogen debranching enzyme
VPSQVDRIIEGQQRSGRRARGVAWAKADRRGYTAIFGRDAAVCAIGMAVSGNKSLQRAAPAGLHTLARYQAANGQIPKFVDLKKREADFWYLGCIDATSWRIIALALLDG